MDSSDNSFLKFSIKTSGNSEKCPQKNLQMMFFVWQFESDALPCSKINVKSEIQLNSRKQLRELTHTVSVYISLLDEQIWQCAGVTISGVDMTVLEMTENNCWNNGEIIRAWDRQWENDEKERHLNKHTLDSSKTSAVVVNLGVPLLQHDRHQLW